MMSVEEAQRLLDAWWAELATANDQVYWAVRARKNRNWQIIAAQKRIHAAQAAIAAWERYIDSIHLAWTQAQIAQAQVFYAEQAAKAAEAAQAQQQAPSGGNVVRLDTARRRHA